MVVVLMMMTMKVMIIIEHRSDCFFLVSVAGHDFCLRVAPWCSERNLRVEEASRRDLESFNNENGNLTEYYYGKFKLDLDVTLARRRCMHSVQVFTFKHAFDLSFVWLLMKNVH